MEDLPSSRSALGFSLRYFRGVVADRVHRLFLAVPYCFPQSMAALGLFAGRRLLITALAFTGCIAAMLGLPRGRSGVFAIIRCRSPDDKQFADVLDRGRTELFTDQCEVGQAGLAIIAEHADLDQFVTIQTACDFAQNGFGQSVLANDDDRGKSVRAGTQGAALFGIDFEHGTVTRGML